MAIKKLNKTGGAATCPFDAFCNSTKEEAAIRSEIEFLAVAKGHPNITALFGVFCDREPAEQEPARPEKPEA